MKRWIVYFKQRAHGSDRWVEANVVTYQTQMQEARKLHAAARAKGVDHA